MCLYWALLSDLAIFSMRISAFVPSHALASPWLPHNSHLGAGLRTGGC